MKNVLPLLFLFLFSGVAFTVNYVYKSAGQDCCTLESLKDNTCCETAGQAAAGSSESSAQVLLSALPFEDAAKSVDNKANCEPAQCDPANCELSKCDLSKCDVSKCIPQKGEKSL